MNKLCLLFFLGFASCDAQNTDTDVDTDPADPVAAEIEVEPETLRFTAIGETANLTAVVYDEEGQSMSDVVVEWSSADDSVVSVSEDGLATAVGVGATTLTAAVGEVTQEMAVEMRLFFLADNGVTVLCPNAAIGEVGAIDGVNYTRVDSEQLFALAEDENWADMERPVSVESMI
jgi:hypothetical protein